LKSGLGVKISKIAPFERFGAVFYSPSIDRQTDGRNILKECV